MATLLDLSKRAPSQPARRDHQLMCDGCKMFTLHCFDHVVPIGIRVVDVVYECSRCGEHRVYGREDTDQREDDDEDVDDRPAA